MPKIKIIESCAGLTFSYAAGQIVDADPATARDLVGNHLAEYLEGEREPQKVIKIERAVAPDRAEDAMIKPLPSKPGRAQARKQPEKKPVKK